MIIMTLPFNLQPRLGQEKSLSQIGVKAWQASKHTPNVKEECKQLARNPHNS
jgi:hypothetical protein